jgi:hypothetical protein
MQEVLAGVVKIPAISRFWCDQEVNAFSGVRRCAKGARFALMPSSSLSVRYTNWVESRMANGRAGAAKPSCEGCFFHQNMLCAVSDTGPCATFRPAHPDGLRPPSQLRFVFRQERRMQVAYAFPSASEQVALHA